MTNPGRRLLILLLLACFGIRLAFCLRIAKNDSFYPDGYDYSRVAVGIVQGRGYYPPEMKPILLYRPPLYPFLLAAVYRAAGQENFTAVRIFQCLLAVGIGILFFGIGRLLAGERAGLLATALFALHPFFIYHCATVAPETTLTFFILLSYFFLFKLFRSAHWRHAAAAGIFLGLAILTKGTALLIGLAAAVTLTFFFSEGFQKGVALAILLGSVMLVVVSPLPLWVYQRWHQFSIILDGSGLNFWIANSDESQRLFQSKTRTEFQEVQKHLWTETLPAMDRRIQDRGPQERDAYYFKLGKQDFQKDPGRSFWMMGQRFKIFWSPWVQPRAYGWKEVLLSGAASLPIFLFGFWELFRRWRARQPDALFSIALILLSTAVVGMIFNTEIRFRVPLLDDLLLLYAACFWSRYNLTHAFCRPQNNL